MTPRALSGATILQIVPALRGDAAGHAAMDTALLLLQGGARTIIAGDDGDLVGELRALGGEFLPLGRETFNPVQLRGNARFLRDYVLTERVDIVHAHSAASAWSALSALHELPAWLVTSFPDAIARDTWLRRTYQGVLARGNRVIAPSSFVSLAMIERYGIAPDRISVVPRSIDTAAFSAAAVSDAQIGAMRRAWGVLAGQRVIFAPQPIDETNGQVAILEAMRLLIGLRGERDTLLVLADDARRRSRAIRILRERARAHGLDTLLRFAGPIDDEPHSVRGAAPPMTLALAAADVVVVTPSLPPPTARVVAEAQAMGRPVVVSATGTLPEHTLFPPRMPEDLRTGWVVRAGHADETAQALHAVLSLNTTAYAALGARARQFAEFMFSPRSVAEATRAVYTSVLARDE